MPHEPECKHLKARAKEHDPRGYFRCPDCGCLVGMHIVLNNWFDELQRLADAICT